MRSLLVCAGVVLGITRVQAQVAPADNKPEAQRLFEEGRKLLADGDPDEACAKFEKSILKDPRAVGTLLNLGLCNERSGKVATAVRLFREAFDRASEANMAAERQAAQEHIAALSHQVPNIVLKPVAPPVAGTKLFIDDMIVSLDQRKLPFDPGRHEVVLSAPGRLPYSTTLEVVVGKDVELSLPVLEQAQSNASARGFTGKVALLGGLGLIVGASGLAGWGWHRYHQPFDDGRCVKSATPGELAICDLSGQQTVDRARLYGTIATVVGSIGIAAAVTGGVLLWTSRTSERHLVPTGSSDTVGLVYLGRF